MTQPLVLLPMNRAEGKTTLAVQWLRADPHQHLRYSRVIVCSHRTGVEHIRYIMGNVYGGLDGFTDRVMTVEEWRGRASRWAGRYHPELQVCLDDADDFLCRQIPMLTRLTITAQPWES